MTKKVFDPQNPEEPVRGWALHAAKARRKHEEGARAPIVPDRVHDHIEREFVGFELVTTAKALGTS